MLPRIEAPPPPAPGTSRYHLGTLNTASNPRARTWTTLASFGYRTEAGAKIVVPPGFTFDGASVPPFAWSIVGGPASAGNFEPACLHDWMRTRLVAYGLAYGDRVFREMLLYNGKPPWKAAVMFGIVRAHGIWVYRPD